MRSDCASSKVATLRARELRIVLIPGGVSYQGGHTAHADTTTNHVRDYTVFNQSEDPAQKKYSQRH